MEKIPPEEIVQLLQNFQKKTMINFHRDLDIFYTKDIEMFEKVLKNSNAKCTCLSSYCVIMRSLEKTSKTPAPPHVFIIHGRKDNSPRPETSNSFSGRKRSNSASTYVAFTSDKIRSVCADTPDCSRSLKMLGKEAISDWSEKYHKDKVQFQMQSSLQPTSVHFPLSSRTVLLPSKLEHSTPQNSGLMGHCSSRFAQSGIFSSYASKDVNFGAVHMSQPAADEGSRPGIKGSGALNTVASRSGPTERNIPSVLPSSNWTNSTQINEPDPSNPLRLIFWSMLFNQGSRLRFSGLFLRITKAGFDGIKYDIFMTLSDNLKSAWLQMEFEN